MCLKTKEELTNIAFIGILLVHYSSHKNSRICSDIPTTFIRQTKWIQTSRYNHLSVELFNSKPKGCQVDRIFFWFIWNSNAYKQDANEMMIKIIMKRSKD